MIEVIIAYDNNDADLGIFFELCKNDCITIINSVESNLARVRFSDVPSLQCSHAYLTINKSHLLNQPFITIVFTHGNNDSVVVNGNSFINANDDNSFFSQSFFYTNSCSTGKILGPKLIEQECRVFIGYSEKIYSFKNEYSDISLKCDTIGITSFLTEDITAYDAYQNMIKLYTQESRKMQNNFDVLAAGLMIEAREALTFLGDKEAKSDDFKLAV